MCAPRSAMRATFSLLVLTAALTALPVGARAQSSSPAAHRQTIADYCAGCHNNRLRTGGLSLDGADLAAVSSHSDLWEKVVRKLRLGVMPPQGSRRPAAAVLDGLAASLETE